jgi:UDP-N-acetyl-D-glucosamine dehydrogenase
VQKVVDAVNEQGKSIVGADVVILGLAYKPNIDDDRESPSFELLELLAERGANVAYCDPHIPRTRRGRKRAIELESVPCTAEALRGFDAIVVATAHDEFKDPALYDGSKLVVDTRNIVPPGAARVVRA